MTGAESARANDADPELEGVVAEARRPKAEHFAAAFAHEIQERYPGPFSERVAQAQADTGALWEAGGQAIEFARARSRAQLGPGAGAAEVDALAKRRSGLGTPAGGVHAHLR